MPTVTPWRPTGLVSEMVEVALVNDEYRAAGTADRIFRSTMPLIPPDGLRIEPGELIIGDLKTGKTLDFSLPDYCVQMALYATGRLYDVHTDKRAGDATDPRSLDAADPPARRQGAL